MDKSTNSLNWFEIPTANLQRARKFYETIFGVGLQEMEAMETKMALFPLEMGSGKVSGALCEGTYYKPSSEGALIYFNGDPNLQTVLDKIEKAGGKIQLPKTAISPEIGYMAIFFDSEGNRVALHSRQ